MRDIDRKIIEDAARITARGRDYRELLGVAWEGLQEAKRKYQGEGSKYSFEKYAAFLVKKRCVDSMRRYRGKALDDVSTSLGEIDPGSYASEEDRYDAAEELNHLLVTHGGKHTELIRRVLIEGHKGKDEAKRVGITPGRVSQIVRKFKEDCRGVDSHE